MGRWQPFKAVLFSSCEPGIHLRTIQWKSKDGTVVHLSGWRKTSGWVQKTSVAKVVHSFGREVAFDRDSLPRMRASVTRDIGVAAPASAEGDGRSQADERLRPVGSRPFGGGWLLDGLRHQLGIDRTMKAMLK